MKDVAKQNLYRKYRPQSFSELLGQDHITRTLQTAVFNGRIAHAYLFSGPRGTGKTSAARLLAKVLNCRTQTSPAKGMVDACRTCDICKRIEDLNFMDIVEIDAASNNGVDDIRQMREKVKFMPVEGLYKVYIIDEVHMLSGPAFNAFLKTLEDPPPRVFFVLATTEQQKVPATIVSRCQCFDFHAIPQKVMINRLLEVVVRERAERPDQFPQVRPEAIHLICECAQGSFRDALGLLDQVSSYQAEGVVSVDDVLSITRRLGYPVLRDLAGSLFSRDAKGLLQKLNELFIGGYDVGPVGRDLLEFLRKSLLLKLNPSASGFLELAPEQTREMQEQTAQIPIEFLVGMVSKFERTMTGLRYSVAPRILFEVDLVRITLREISVGNEGLERRLDQIEGRLKTPFMQPRVVTVVPRPKMSTLSALPTKAPSVVAEPRPATYGSEKPAEPLGETSISERFKAVKSRLAKAARVLGALFQNASLDSLEGGAMVITIESDFAAAKCREQKAIEAIKANVELEFGAIQTIRILGPSDNKALNPDPEMVPAKIPIKHSEEIAKIDRAVRQAIIDKTPVADALAVFGGEIIQVEKNVTSQ